jgi:outer membrane protein assembly factor BamB
MAPTFVPGAYGDGTTGKDSVIVGQKSGQMYSWDASTGKLQWSVLTAPQEGLDGGPGAMSWGVASDDRSIYYTIINFGARNLTLLGAPDPVNNSAWGSLSLKTGALQWQVPVPDLQMAYTPPAVVNDVVFVGRSGSRTVTNDDVKLQVPGAVIALSKSSGATLATWPLDSIQRGGVTVAGGFILFGTGYHYQNSFKTGGIHVYGLPGAIAEAKVALAVTVRSPEPATGEEEGAPDPSGTKNAPAAATTQSRAPRTGVLSMMYPVLGLAMFVVYFG